FTTDSRPAAYPVGTMRLSGALNGKFSGMVVVRSEQALQGLKVVPGVLKHTGKDNTLPASAVDIGYLVPQSLLDLGVIGDGGRGMMGRGLNREALDNLYYASTNPDLLDPKIKDKNPVIQA